jgi:drug/metabolite transporter (DMT)-like permease
MRRDTGRSEALALLALVGGSVAMGASPVFVRFADVGPFASAFWRAFLALPVLLAWDAAVHGRRGEKSVPIGSATWLAGIFFAGDLIFWHLAILNTTVANATFLATTAPVFVALGAWLLLGERPSFASFGGLVLCLSGGLALLGESYGFAPERLHGDAAGLCTAVFFGAYVLAASAARARLGAARLMLVSTAITSVCLLVVALLLEPRLLPGSIEGFVAVLALALVSQAAGQGLVAIALGTLPATFSALVIFLEAVAAAGFGWIVLGEALGAVQAFGGVLILAGIFVARPRAPAPAPA